MEPESQVKLNPEAVGAAVRRIYASGLGNGIGEMLFANSFMLLYFSLLGIPGERILLYLSLPVFISVFTLLPFAYWSERLGKKPTALAGLYAGALSMAVLVAAGFLKDPFVEPVVMAAVAMYGLGNGLYLACWLPLVSAIIPSERRGSFFGNNRLIYQTATIIFTFAAMWALERNAAIGVLQAFLAAAVVFRLIGTSIFMKVPEIERAPGRGAGLWSRLVNVIRFQGYLPYCAYVFLLSLFTGACPSLFGLLAKDTLGMSGSEIMLVGNMATVGSLAGFFAGGRLVDRIGTKCVFMACHFSFSVILGAILLRDAVPVAPVATLGALSLLFGLVQASSGVAISSETLAAMPKDNKAMASAVSYALMFLGTSLSGVFASRMLKLGMLSGSWSLFGMTRGPYDSLMLIAGTMILLLVVTLGLVPSVIKTSRYDGLQ